MTRSRSRASLAVLGATALAALSLTAVPAQADTLPASDCRTDCTATFDTVGGAFDFVVPHDITELSVTIAGGAGAPPSFAITNDPTAVGGAGGVTTIELGAGYADETLLFGVGGPGEGSYLQSSAQLLAVAGGGGQGGYAAYLTLPGQILATYPGGVGGVSATPGVTAGGNGDAFSGNAANGLGGTSVGGLGGTGTYNASAGDATTVTTAAGSTLAVGGAGGTVLVDSITHNGGVGGTGYTGGGGGAIAIGLEGGDVPVDLVAPAGGGSGFLTDGLAATTGEPNAGTGSVTFTWSLVALPTPSTAPVLPTTGLTTNPWILWIALGLLVAGIAVVVITRVRKARNSNAPHED